MKSTGSIHNKLDSVLTYFVSLKEHSRKGGLRASRDKDKDKDDRESGARSRRERQTSARKGRQAHGAASPPPSITPAAEDDKGLVLVRTCCLLYTHAHLYAIILPELYADVKKLRHFRALHLCFSL